MKFWTDDFFGNWLDGGDGGGENLSNPFEPARLGFHSDAHFSLNAPRVVKGKPQSSFLRAS